MATPAQLIDRIALTARLRRTLELTAVSACVTENSSGATFATETTDANDAGADDVTMPDPFDTSDAIYAGYSATFTGLVVNTGTAGVGDAVVAEMVWEYWDGALWQSLPGVTDNTSGFTVAGRQVVSFDAPADWGTTSVNALGPFYYVRLRATADDVWNTTQPTLTSISIRVGGLDRALALSFLQEAASRVCGDADVRVPADSTVNLTSGTAVYTLGASPFPTDMIALLNIKLTDAAVTRIPVDRITMHEMDALRVGSQATGTPFVYATDWPQLQFYPTPGAGTSVSIQYSQTAPTLADNATTISFIPDFLQWQCLLEFALYRAFEYKGDLEQANYHLSAYSKDGLRAVRRWKIGSGGRLGPESARGVRPVIASTSQDLGF